MNQFSRVRLDAPLGYFQPGAYFVTIRTHQKKCVLGGVENGWMVLNEIGQIVQKTWTEPPTHYTGVDVDRFVVMPNHLHEIILTDYCRGGVTPPILGARRPRPYENLHWDKLLRISNTGQPNQLINYSIHQEIASGSGTITNTLYETKIGSNPLKWELDEENPNICL